MSDSIRSIQKHYQMEYLMWMSAMVGVCSAMPDFERAKLDKWESENLGRTGLGTSDWPGWEKYIGKIPQPPDSALLYKKKPIPVQVRIAVWRRDGFTCLHCQATAGLSVDHIIPESRGGSSELDNLQTLCRQCNSKKGRK